ncbi:MAG: hypothetical protein D8M58_13925 [Calditrichaeota bacterium]|nr:MAG: hypothetical protein DWQ03_15165 [Calditrichota bacterium]MBL1206498.1 hypothetical protein [Calditrichota bacterium]NOG46325.1 hypothetical protein [Calditrichota bacterium]
MKKIPYLLFLLFLLVHILPAQLIIKNQSEYSNWQNENRTIWENWTDINYQYDFLKTGLRFEVNDPPDPSKFQQPDLVKKHELTYKFVELNYEGLTARLGNFYSMFGRGLILRTYENRNIPVDNNIEGLQLKYRTKVFNSQVIAGKIRDSYNRRAKLFYGTDLGVKLNKELKIGASALVQDKDKKKSIMAANINYIYDWFDIYLEVASPQWERKLSNYIALNAIFEKFTLTAEHKNYNNLLFPNKYQIEYAAGPSLLREHSFTLLNRHPHLVEMNNEMGYQFELTWFPDDLWQLMLNYSLTNNQKNQRQFEEYYFEVTRPFGDSWEVLTALDWSYDLSSGTENITPLVDLYYNLNSRNQIHVSLQHQHTLNVKDKSEFDSELALLEFSHSPWLTMALVGEITNENQLNNVPNNKKNTWLYGNVIFSFGGSHQLSVLYGSRQAGFVCVGGVCRLEPEFEGVEIKLTNRF